MQASMTNLIFRQSVRAGLAGVWLTVLCFSFVGLALAQSQTPSVSFAVRVTDARSERPIDQARIELSKFPDGVLMTVFTDSSGRYEFFRIVPQNYVLRVTKNGYRPAEVAVDARRGEFSRQVVVQMLPEIPGSQPLGGVVSTKALAIPKPAAEAVKKGLQALNERKDVRQGIEHFLEAIKLHPEYAEAYFLIGTAHMQQKTFDEAQSAFEKSIELDASFAKPYYPLAVLLASQKRYQESDKLLLRAMELEPQSWQGPFELGRSYANRQIWDKAIAYSEMACAKQNPASKVHLLMADVYSNTGSVEKAIKELELFIKLDPKSPYVPRVKESLAQLKQPK